MITTLSTYISEETQVWTNQAIESFLLGNVQQGECILYLWQNKNTVVIGRNQNAWNECNVIELERSNGLLARRLSGGGAVFHDLGNLNFTFLTHAQDYDVTKQNSVILEAVRAFGIDAKMSGRNDLLINDKKFSGHAYHRSGNRCFHHGTIMVDVDRTKLVSYLTVPTPKREKNSVRSVRSRVINLCELNPNLTIPSLAQQLMSTFSNVYDLPLNPFPKSRFNQNALEEERRKFADWDWRYGKRTNFPEKVTGQFLWGTVEIGYHVNHGTLSDVILYSDGMEADFLSTIPKHLEGSRYTPQALSERLMEIEANTLQQKTILEDVNSLFAAI